MVMVANGPAAYGPAKTIISLIERFRGAGLPSTLSVESLPRVGVSESLAPRTLQSLKLLDLVDDQGKPTPQFEDLRRAPTAEYKSELIDILKLAYVPVFEIVEPANATFEQVQDAFRSFTPQGQRDRMVSLFLSLLEYAEYSDSLPSVRSSSPARAGRESSTQSGTGRNGKASPRVLPPPPEPPLPATTRIEDRFYTHKVKLGSAGTLTLTVDMNPWELRGPHREFFNELTDRVLAYEEAHQTPPVSNDGAADNSATEERVS